MKKEIKFDGNLHCPCGVSFRGYEVNFFLDHQKLCPITLKVQEKLARKKPSVEALKELEEIFELRWKADMRAIKMWRKGHPERKLVMPDHADLVLWLLAKLESPSCFGLFDEEYTMDSECARGCLSRPACEKVAKRSSNGNYR